MFFFFHENLVRTFLCSVHLSKRTPGGHQKSFGIFLFYSVFFFSRDDHCLASDHGNKAIRDRNGLYMGRTYCLRCLKRAPHPDGVIRWTWPPAALIDNKCLDPWRYSFIAVPSEPGEEKKNNFPIRYVRPSFFFKRNTQRTRQWKKKTTKKLSTLVFLKRGAKKLLGF